MLGPSFGHVATSIVGLVFMQRISLDYIFPFMAPTLATAELVLGRVGFLFGLGVAISTFGYWGFGLIMTLPAIYRVERWKILPNRKLDVEALQKTLPLVMFNVVFGTMFASVANLTLLPPAAFDWEAKISTSTLFRDAFVTLLLEEVLFYYGHRFLHENKRAYAKIHKLHHTWTDPVAIVAVYCHPLEHIVSNIIPAIAGPILCGMHIAAFGTFTFAATIHTTGVHSGYWFCDDNGMHHEHHVKFNVNYGVVGLLDYLHGTYSLPDGAADGGTNHKNKSTWEGKTD